MIRTIEKGKVCHSLFLLCGPFVFGSRLHEKICWHLKQHSTGIKSMRETLVNSSQP